MNFVPLRDRTTRFNRWVTLSLLSVEESLLFTAVNDAERKLFSFCWSVVHPVNVLGFVRKFMLVRLSGEVFNRLNEGDGEPETRPENSHELLEPEHDRDGTSLNQDNR